MKQAERVARRFNELYGEAVRDLLPEQPSWEELQAGGQERLVAIFETLLSELSINPYLPG